MNKTALISAFFSGAASIGAITPKVNPVLEATVVKSPAVWEDVGKCFNEAWGEIMDASEAFTNV